MLSEKQSNLKHYFSDGTLELEPDNLPMFLKMDWPKPVISARKETHPRNHVMAHPDYDREIRITRTAHTTQDKIWSCWTTESGMGSWWAQNCRIEPRVGGAYELYFLMDNPPGTQGGEGNTILALEPETRLSFS